VGGRRPAPVADIKNTQGFKILLAQTEAELLTRGLDVVPVGVRNMLAHAVNTIAERMGVQSHSALRYIDPAVIADQIAKAGAAPPLARTTWPLTQCPAGAARKATILAMSAGAASRSIEGRAASRATACSSWPSRNSFVEVGPGATALTVMSRRAAPGPG